MVKYILPAILICIALPTHPVRAAQSPTQVVSDQVEAAFRSAMSAWAYGEFWHLWETGTRMARFAMTREEFASRMERSGVRPAAGRQVEAIEVQATSLEGATVYVRFGIEESRTGRTRSLFRRFTYIYEDGRWCPNLYDFLGLAGY